MNGSMCMCVYGSVYGSVCMCAYGSVCVHMGVCMCAYGMCVCIWECVHVCIWECVMRAYGSVYMCARGNVCVCIWECVHVCIWECVCVCVWLCAHVTDGQIITHFVIPRFWVCHCACSVGMTTS